MHIDTMLAQNKNGCICKIPSMKQDIKSIACIFLFFFSYEVYFERAHPSNRFDQTLSIIRICDLNALP